MKYYICITPFYPEPNRFYGPYVEDQVKAIERNSEYKVIVMKPCPAWSMKEDYEYNGMQVYWFKDYTVPSNMWPNVLCDWLTSKALVKKLNSIGVEIDDIAVAHGHVTKQGAYANYLKILNPNIVTVVQHHGFDIMGVTDGRLAKYNFHAKRCVSHGVVICNKADVNIGVSQKTLDYVLEQPEIKLKQRYVLYNGVDTTIFNKGEGPSRQYSQQDCFHIGCVGNFWELKDQMTLIKAVGLLVCEGIKNIRVSLIGSGYNMDNCKQYVHTHNLGEYIQFCKEVFHDKLPEFYRSLDLFVLPSYWEAFGCVYTEAYACGVPFIGVKGQGISEIVPKEDEDKWLIEKGDYLSLAKLIRERMDNPPVEQKLAISIDINDLIKDYLKHLK